MKGRRSLRGLPALWLLALGVCCVANFLAGQAALNLFRGLVRSGLADIYVVDAGWHFILPSAAVFLVFAVVYGLLDWRAPGSYSRTAALLQLGFMVIGCLLIGSATISAAIAWRRLGDQVAAFSVANRIIGVGYGACLISLGLFVAVLASLLLRRARVGKSGA